MAQMNQDHDMKIWGKNMQPKIVSLSLNRHFYPFQIDSIVGMLCSQGTDDWGFCHSVRFSLLSHRILPFPQGSQETALSTVRNVGSFSITASNETPLSGTEYVHWEREKVLMGTHGVFPTRMNILSQPQCVSIYAGSMQRSSRRESMKSMKLV